jgi:hypothetical protein
MAKKCYLITYTNCAGVSGSAYICAEDLVYLPGGSCGGGYFASISNNYGATNASQVLGTVVQVSMGNCPDCSELKDNQPYDCINGGCVPKKTYNTPGVFANLSACEAGCAKNSDCPGECVTAEDIANLKQAANNLQARHCK